jgi:hypothetical protein
MKYADGCGHRVQNKILGGLEFSDAEIARTLVKSKTNVHRLDVSLKVPFVDLRRFNQRVMTIVESEVITNEG